MTRLALLLLAAAGPAPAPAPIDVTVTGLRAATGRVKVLVCPQAQWMAPRCPYQATAAATATTVTVRVPAVPPGAYAVTAFHDANGNDRIDRNLLGIPKERVGFSNDAPVHFAPPRFEDARIVHGGAPQAIRFRLRSFP